MSSSKQTDWEQKLRNLEKDIHDSTPPTLPVRPFNPKADSPQLFNRITAWYQGLTSPAKVSVAIAGTVLTLMVLNGVLKLVASLIAIAPRSGAVNPFSNPKNFPVGVRAALIITACFVFVI